MFSAFAHAVTSTALFRIPSRRFFIYALIITIGVLLFYHLGAEIRDNYAINEQSIIAFVSDAGSLSWLVFSALVALAVMSPLPSSALGLVGGYVFSPFTALALIALGEVVGATVNYLLGRYVIRHVVTKERFPVVYANIARYKSYLTGYTVFLLGLVPAGTANVTGYTAGLIGMRYWVYIMSWSSGIMLLSTLTTFLGHSARTENIVASAFLGIGVIMMLLYGRKYVRWLTWRLKRLLV